jgi:hypothetical protein
MRSRRFRIGTMATVGLAGLATTACGGSSLSGASSCRSFLKASLPDQHVLVRSLATKDGKPAYARPTGQSEMAYYCVSHPEETLALLLAVSGQSLQPISVAALERCLEQQGAAVKVIAPGSGGTVAPGEAASESPSFLANVDPGTPGLESQLVATTPAETAISVYDSEDDAQTAMAHLSQVLATQSQNVVWTQGGYRAINVSQCVG